MADSNPQELSQGAQDASGVPEGMVGMMGVHPGAGMDLQSQQVTELQLQQMQMAAAAAAAAAAAGGGVDLPSSPKRKKSDTLDRGDTTKKREKNRVAAAASRARKKEYVQNLEKAIHVLTTEKLELQVKVATLTNQLWEQSIKIDELEKQIAELKALKAGGKPPSADDAAPQPYPPEDGSGAPQPDAGMPSV